MKSAGMVLLVSTLAMGQVPVNPHVPWTLQLGMVRGMKNAYTDQETGTHVGLAWARAITAREAFVVWVDHARIEGARNTTFKVMDPNNPAYPWMLIPGRGTWKQDGTALGVDYRVAFLKTATTPYVFVGPVIGTLHAEEHFVGSGYDATVAEPSVGTGISWGAGCQILHRFDVQLRFRNYSNAEKASHANLSVGYRF